MDFSKPWLMAIQLQCEAIRHEVLDLLNSEVDIALIDKLTLRVLNAHELGMRFLEAIGVERDRWVELASGVEREDVDLVLVIDFK